MFVTQSTVSACRFDKLSTAFDNFDTLFALFVITFDVGIFPESSITLPHNTEELLTTLFRVRVGFARAVPGQVATRGPKVVADKNPSFAR